MFSVLFVGHTYLTALAQKKLTALKEQGCRICVLVPSNWRDLSALFEGKWLIPHETESLSLRSAPVIRSGHVASHLYIPGTILRMIRLSQPDIVQVEQEVYSFVAAQAALEVKASGRKLVIFGWENLDRHIHLTQRFCRVIILKLADAIVCGNRDGALLVRKWGYNGIVEVMPQLGVDPLEFSPMIRQQLRQGGGTFSIGYVGRMVPEKGGDTLLQAFSALVNKNLDIHLIMLGSGPEKQNWQKLASDLGITEHVSWYDSVPHNEVPSIMAQMDVLVLPSKSTSHWKEQFGLVLAQAMAMGLPVIGSNCGAIPEVIGRQDVIFPEGNKHMLSHILERMVLDENWRKEVSQYCHEKALSLYTNEVLARRLIKLYSSLTNSR